MGSKEKKVQEDERSTSNPPLSFRNGHENQVLQDKIFYNPD